MELTRGSDLWMWPQYQGAEDVFVVHHVEEREAGVWPRCREQLEERAVSVAGCRVATGTPCVAAANPWLQGREFRLESGFSIYSARTLFLQTPAAGLAGAPE